MSSWQGIGALVIWLSVVVYLFFDATDVAAEGGDSVSLRSESPLADSAEMIGTQELGTAAERAGLVKKEAGGALLHSEEMGGSPQL